MVDNEAKPLQAQFDVGDLEVGTEEGIGFEPGTRYTFSIDKEPQGKYMQYGAKRTDGLAGLYVMSKKIPAELLASYQKHPDQFEIFTAGEINGQQALVPGKDFDKFKQFLTPTIKLGWKCKENNRLVFMDLGDATSPRVNTTHPEWESVSVRLARRLGINVPEPKINGKPNPEKFNWSFLHVGVEISAETLNIKSKDPQYRDQIALDIDTIERLGAGGAAADPQAKLPTDDIDADLKIKIMEAATDAKTPAEVFKKIVAAEKGMDSKSKASLLAAITRMKDAKEILA